MFIFETIIFMLKVLVIGVIIGVPLVFIISYVTTKSKVSNSSTSYDNSNIDNNNNILKAESVTYAPSLKISSTLETPISCNEDRKWDDITQSEIDSIKCYGDNMSMHEYVIHAKYIPTNRIRTVKVIAIDENDALSKLTSEYNKESATVSFSEYPPLSDRQKQYAIYLGIHVPEKCCSYDLSALIDQGGLSQPAPTVLTEFAVARNLCFSYYRNESYLIRLIFSSLNIQEKIAFSLVYMNKYITQIWDFSNWKTYIEFSTECMNNNSFMNSFKRIITNFDIDNTTCFDYDHISHNTIFYKTLKNFILNQ
ncbi:MAG: hypothetical protein HDR71_15605 [Lachnospiraceae bacterium]|nr:hypothetical protein [Lachnospiraceae bacterium]